MPAADVAVDAVDKSSCSTVACEHWTDYYAVAADEMAEKRPIVAAAAAERHTKANSIGCWPDYLPGLY